MWLGAEPIGLATQKKVRTSERFFLAFSLQHVLRATAACIFWSAELPRVFRSWRPQHFFDILACTCASHHRRVHCLINSASKSNPNMWCFYHLDLEMCFVPQRRAIFDLSSPRWLHTRRFSPKCLEKHSVSRLFYLFARLDLLSSLSLSLHRHPEGSAKAEGELVAQSNGATLWGKNRETRLAAVHKVIVAGLQGSLTWKETSELSNSQRRKYSLADQSLRWSCRRTCARTWLRQGSRRRLTGASCGLHVFHGTCHSLSTGSNSS